MLVAHDTHVMVIGGAKSLFRNRSKDFALESADYHQQEEDAFADAAADQLNRLLTNGATAILIAAPHVPGVIRKRLTPEARSRITTEGDKGYTQRSIADITALLVSL